MNYLLIFITILGTVIGQIILKYGQSSLFYPKEWNIKQIFSALLNNLFSIYFILAILFALIGALAWSLVIQKFNLSFAYPFMSLTYILIFLACYFLFKEPINIYQIIGMACIVAGIIFIGLK